jgi:predicted secreted protein
MPITTACAIFFLIWWIVLFAVLPWGVRSQHEEADMTPGTDPGAPVIPNVGRKLVWTTLVSVLIFAGCYVVYVHRLVTLDGLMDHFYGKM